LGGGDFDRGEKEFRWSNREIAGGGRTVGERVRRRKKKMRMRKKASAEAL
jgi:hypothetical protein